MFLKRENNILYFLFFIFFSIFLLFFDFYYHLSNKIHFYSNKFIFFYYYIFDNLFFYVKKKILFLQNFKEIYYENIFLKKKKMFFNKKILYSNFLKLENNYFRKILNLPLLNKEKNFSLVRVFFYHFNNIDEIIINHIRNLNIKYGSLLFNSIGSMLGKVVYSGNNFSKVQLICNNNSSFPVSILRNNLNSIILGFGCKNYMRIDDFSIEADIKIGDIVIIPWVNIYSFSGYPIGVVDNISLNFNDGVLMIYVKYFLELDNLSFGFLYN